MRLRAPAFLHGGTITAAIAMAARVSNQLALVVVTLVATRMLQPADFGVFAIAAAFITLSRTMLYTGPFEYLLKAPEPRAIPVASACLAANGIVAGGWFALLVALGMAAPLIFAGSGVAPVMLALAPSTLLAALAGWLEAMLLRSGQVRRYYGLTVAIETASGVGAIALLVAGFGLWALVAQVYLRLALFVVAYRLVLRLPRLHRPEAAELRSVLRWSRSRYGSVLVGFLANYSGDLLLGIAFSPAASGLYRASNRMVTALADMFNQPAGLLATTTMAAARSRGEAGTEIWLRLLALFAALSWPALAVLALLADRIVPLALGPAWAAAGPIVAVFCVARMAGLVATVASSALVVSDRHGRVLAVQGMAALATAGLTLVAAPYGPQAAAMASAVVGVIAATVLGRAALRTAQHDRVALGETVKAVLVPLAGGFCAALLADTLLRRTGIHQNWSVVIVAVSAGLGWLLAARSVFSVLERGLAMLGGRAQAA